MAHGLKTIWHPYLAAISGSDDLTPESESGDDEITLPLDLVERIVTQGYPT
jgi:hypothetical protein